MVQRIKPEAKTASGIFLPESSVKEQNEAKVLAVGPGGLDKNGNRIPMSVAPGDKVLIPQVRFFILTAISRVYPFDIYGFIFLTMWDNSSVEAPSRSVRMSTLSSGTMSM